MAGGRPAGGEPGGGHLRWSELRAELRGRLADPVDVDRIVERACGDDWRLRLDDPVPARAVPFVEAMAERRAAGEPLQYVVGRWGFRSLDLLVDGRVLIPRPETEQVVDVLLRRLPEALGDERAAAPVVADLGTGSGAIAIAVASELPRAQVWGTDVSADALAVARANVAGAGTFVAPRVRLAEGSWFDALPDDVALDAVVSNPPYIADGEVLPGEVEDFEPSGALRSGPSGLECVTAVVRDARPRLRTPGLVVVEIGATQGEAAVSLAGLFGYADARVDLDLAGRPRVLSAVWRG